MTMTVSDLLASLGHEPSLPSWDARNENPVPVSRWGRDHWTTFAYVETRWVDHHGMLSHDQLRCDRQRHPVFYSAKRRVITVGTGLADGAKYPTRLKTETPGEDGRWGTVELTGHDDYDCIDDAIREGLLEAIMPRLREPHRDIFLDARGRPVRVPDGELISAELVTGLTEMWLMTAASFALTDRGQAIARELRAHLAAAGDGHQFMPSEATRGPEFPHADRTVPEP
jgi:hypothetical protein